MTVSLFTDLAVWQECHKLVLLIYKISRTFPSDEKFGLINQLRRAVVSVTSNISEGFSRQSNKEKIQFYFMSLGSLLEVQNQVIIARDLEYLSMQKYGEIQEQIILCKKLIRGFIKSAANLHNR